MVIAFGKYMTSLGLRTLCDGPETLTQCHWPTNTLTGVGAPCTLKGEGCKVGTLWVQKPCAFIRSHSWYYFVCVEVVGGSSLQKGGSRWVQNRRRVLPVRLCALLRPLTLTHKKTTMPIFYKCFSRAHFCSNLFKFSNFLKTLNYQVLLSDKIIQFITLSSKLFFVLKNSTKGAICSGLNSIPECTLKDYSQLGLNYKNTWCHNIEFMQHKISHNFTCLGRLTLPNHKSKCHNLRGKLSQIIIKLRSLCT